jgi:methylglutaconyl-CoA hydratase
MLLDDRQRSGKTVRLGEIARARSGDKGMGANIGVMVESDAHYALLLDQLTAAKVSAFFEPMGVTGVERFELPNLRALNFVLRGILAHTTRVDAQGKALGQAILEMPVVLPEDGSTDRPGDAPATESSFLVERHRPGVVDMVLNRPERRNALTVHLMGELASAITRISADSSNRVLILRGAGPVFCAGLDLVEASNTSLAEAGAEGFARVLSSLIETPLITIAVAHGVAAAGGAGLLAACDFAVATEGLKVVFPEVRRGLVPALVATILRRKLSDADLREILLLGEPIGAARAQAMRLVTRVVVEGSERAEANRLADLILQGAPQAVRNTKALLAELAAAPPSDGLRIAHDHHIQAKLTSEAREGLAAFLEKRQPNWA